jgi:hypothetical protein
LVRQSAKSERMTVINAFSAGVRPSTKSSWLGSSCAAKASACIVE